MLVCAVVAALASVTQLRQARVAPPIIDARRHAVELRDRGFTVLADAGLAAEAVAKARDACSAELACLHRDVARLGIDPVDEKYAFAEIATRHRLRWGLQPQGASAWTGLVDAAVGVAAPVIEELHTLAPSPDDSLGLTGWTRHLLDARPRLHAVDAIVSRPGAKAQGFHADAGRRHLALARLNPRHRLFNVFVPLVDVAEGGDGTMFWPGSHLERTRYDRWHAALGRSASLEDDATAMAEMEAPGCPAGGAIVFDFRLLHRGMPNTGGRERAMAHAVLSTGLAADQLSFPEASLRAAVDALPRDPESAEHRAQREAVAQQQREAWAAVRSSSAR